MLAIILGVADGVGTIANHSTSLKRDPSRGGLRGGGGGEHHPGEDRHMGQIREPGILLNQAEVPGSFSRDRGRGVKLQGRGSLAKRRQKMLVVQLLPGDGTSCLHSFFFRDLFNISNKNKINNCSVHGNLSPK